MKPAPRRRPAQRRRLLTQTLGTPVVPVIGIVGAPVPDSVPAAVDGVLVTAADRSPGSSAGTSHTLLPTHEGRRDRRAGPAAARHSPGTTPRVARSAAARPSVPRAVGAAHGARATVAPAQPAVGATAPPAIASRPAAARRRPAGAPANATTAQSCSPGAPAARSRPVRRRHRIGSLCLVAFAAGSLVQGAVTVRRRGDAATVGRCSSTSCAVDHDYHLRRHRQHRRCPPPHVPPVARRARAAVDFPPVCPRRRCRMDAGAELARRPGRPVRYEVEVLAADGTWAPHSFATRRRRSRRPPSPVKARTSRSRCRSPRSWPTARAARPRPRR